MTYEVLIVDDDSVDRKLLERQLRSESSLNIRVADSAQEALKMLSELPADLLICDLQMPRIDGFELCGLIRQIFGQCSPKTVLVSGNPHPPPRYTNITPSFDEFCIKTSDGELLIQTTRKLLDSLK
ncbi:MAG: response regulator [Candidatus Omnitrophica bacterium]|nr:response regulator [Candidatus Omnitrophota bacterium]